MKNKGILKDFIMYFKHLINYLGLYDAKQILDSNKGYVVVQNNTQGYFVPDAAISVSTSVKPGISRITTDTRLAVVARGAANIQEDK